VRSLLRLHRVIERLYLRSILSRSRLTTLQNRLFFQFKSECHGSTSTLIHGKGIANRKPNSCLISSTGFQPSSAVVIKIPSLQRPHPVGESPHKWTSLERPALRPVVR